MISLEDELRAALRAKAGEIRPEAPPLRLPARRRRSPFLAYGGGENRRTTAQRAWHGWIAPAACAVLVVAVIAAFAVTFGGSRFASSSPGRVPAVHAHLGSRPSSYLSVSSRPGGRLRTSRSRSSGWRQARSRTWSSTFSNWAQPFAGSYAQTLRKHGAAVMIVQIDPGNASVAGIAAGDYDRYLRSVCRQCPAFRRSRHHRLRARDEQRLVPSRASARPAVGLRSGMAAHRESVPRPGR